MSFNFRGLIIESISATLKNNPSHATQSGLGFGTAERRELWDRIVSEARDGTLKIPHGWLIPFAIIDDEQQETHTPGGMKYGSTVVNVDDVLYRRQYTLERNASWTVPVLICGRSVDDANAKADVFLQRQPKVITCDTEGHGDHKDLHFGAQYSLDSRGVVKFAGIDSEQRAFLELKLRWRFGEFSHEDTALKPIEITDSATEPGEES